MARIIAPSAEFSGKVGPVAFVDGVGQTDDENLLAYFGRQGYEVDSDAADLTEAEAEWTEESTLHDMTVTQLREYAEQNEIDLIDEGGKPLTRKADIVAAIEAVEGDEEID